MKVALVTTTINVPHVLALYAAQWLGVGELKFFIAGDLKTPHTEVVAATDLIDVATLYLTPASQKGWKCSELLGWDTDARRNIAILEALKWGADVLVSVDDDNLPLAPYFADIDTAFVGTFSGILVSGFNNWFDPGRLLVSPATARGFPTTEDSTRWRCDGIITAEIGVVAGTCLGDPDVDAVTRIVQKPEIHNASELLRNGVVVDPHTWTVFNSQNTAYLRELAPAMFIMPGSGTSLGFGRNCDIFASLIAQRVMRAHGLHVRHGRPFVWQQRNPHDLVNDLRGEVQAMAQLKDVAEYLNAYDFDSPADPVLHHTRMLWTDMPLWYPEFGAARKAALAFLDDCEQVL